MITKRVLAGLMLFGVLLVSGTSYAEDMTTMTDESSAAPTAPLSNEAEFIQPLDVIAAKSCGTITGQRNCNLTEGCRWDMAINSCREA